MPQSGKEEFRLPTRPTNDDADNVALANEPTGLTLEATFATLMTQTRDVLVAALRRFFETDTRVPEYLKYSSEPSKNKIYISSESPQSIRLFPAVKVQSGQFQKQNVSFGDKIGVINYQSQGQQFTYHRKVLKYKATWNVIVGTRNTPMRDQLSDFIVEALDIIMHDAVQFNGVIFTTNETRADQDSVVEWDPTTPIFRRTLSFGTWLEVLHDETVQGPVLERIYGFSTFSQAGPKPTETKILASS